jgi:TPR repeat protein
LDAAAGDDAAAAQIGKAYLAGLEAPRNPAQAWVWFTIGARNGKYRDRLADCEKEMTSQEIETAKSRLPKLAQHLDEVRERLRKTR